MTLSLLNSLAVALVMVWSGQAGRTLSPVRVLAVASPVALAVVGIAGALGGATWSAQGITLGVIAGVSGAVGLLFSYRALALGPIGVAGAVIGVTSTASVAVAGWLTESTLTGWGAAGFVLCLVAIVSVSWSTPKNPVSPPMIGFAVVGGLAAGGFAILMNATAAEDGWGPLLVVRVAVVTVALIALAIPSVRDGGVASAQRWRSAWIPAVLAGVADGLANISLVLAVRSVDLATLAIITSIAPALAAVLAWVFLRQRLRRHHIAGVALAVVAIALTSLVTT